MQYCSFLGVFSCSEAGPVLLPGTMQLALAMLSSGAVSAWPSLPAALAADLTCAQLTWGPLAPAALRYTHRLSLLGLGVLRAASRLIFPQHLKQLPTTSPFPKCHAQSTPSRSQPSLCHARRGAPDWVLHMQAGASQTKHPAPHKGMRRKSHKRRAALKAACAKAALLFIQIRTLLNQSDWSLSENI